MAGNYDDPPGHRIPYDRDGTLRIRTNRGATVVNGTGGSLAGLNSEDTSAYQNIYNERLVLRFPVPIDIVALGWACYESFGTYYWQWSPDTTNGVDGQWTTIGTLPRQNSQPTLRNNIIDADLTGVAALRWWADGHTGATANNIHLYGSPTDEQESLILLDDTADVRVDPVELDLADVPRETSRDVVFRVMNNASVTANDVVVSIQFLTDGSPSVVPLHTLSLDGDLFEATVTISQLAPGAISDPVYLRQALADDAPLGLRWGRIVAAAGSWT